MKVNYFCPKNLLVLGRKNFENLLSMTYMHNMHIIIIRESSLEAAGALGAAAPILESISGVEGWSWVGCGCQRDPISDQIPTCLIACIGGIKLKLLCGVRIEAA